MTIKRNVAVPTGNICVIAGDRGDLEFLSIGDYGKNENVKADFLGLCRELNGVPNGSVMPLSEKWVITISTQYGCSMGCKFCDVPKVGPGVNCTYNDLKNQVVSGLMLHPEVTATKRLNIHYARMGEPSFNPDVLRFSYDLMKIVRPYVGRSLVHPVFTTMMPRKNRFLVERLQEWTCDIKNDVFRGCAGLQISVNSTDDLQRDEMFGGSSLSLPEISDICRWLPAPVGRKYCLNFALADNYEVDAGRLASLFDTDKFMVKITPLHATASCDENGIVTTLGYSSYAPYAAAEKDLIDAGFDVLVFVPSLDEDFGRITCGNAILSGSLPMCEYTEAPPSSLSRIKKV